MHRLISILSNISKIYEKCIQTQLNEYFAYFLSKFQCGFQQGFSTQHCLLVMIEKLRKIRDEKGVFAAVLTDVSKAFACLPHQLLIAKLSAYGFDMKSIAFISAYLKNRKRKTNWVYLQRMFEYIIWCPTGFYFGASFISDIYCRSFLFEL